MRETLIQSQILTILNHRNSPCRLWRNNVGYNHETHVRYGLGVGSADLIGLVTSGPRLGLFLAVEIKTPIGRLSKEQKAWLATINKLGGLALVMRTVEDAKNLVKELTG